MALIFAKLKAEFIYKLNFGSISVSLCVHILTITFQLNITGHLYYTGKFY